MPELQWEQDRPAAYHVGRRLTSKEQELVGAVIDLRGTPEAMQRLQAAVPYLSRTVIEFAYQEIGK